MKKICRPLIKWTNRVLAGLLSLSGFSCLDVAPEYGVPHADYSVKGTVTDAAGTAIPGIEIRIKYRGEYEVNEPAYTNEQGRFDVTYSSFPEEYFVLTATDTDGEANGSFYANNAEVVFTEKDFYKKGDGHWYEGAARKEIPPVVLTETDE
jgi:putative lipoprotein (rSAM/lipoprotein system)